MAKKIKQKWIVPDGIAPTEMDFKIMEIFVLVTIRWYEDVI